MWNAGWVRGTQAPNRVTCSLMARWPSMNMSPSDYGMTWGDAPREAFAQAPVEIVVERVAARSDPSKL